MGRQTNINCVHWWVEVGKDGVRDYSLFRCKYCQAVKSFPMTYDAALKYVGRKHFLLLNFKEE